MIKISAGTDRFVQDPEAVAREGAPQPEPRCEECPPAADASSSSSGAPKPSASDVLRGLRQRK